MAGTNPDLVVQVAANIQGITDSLATVSTDVKGLASTASDMSDTLKDAFEHPASFVLGLAGNIGEDLVGSLGVATIEATAFGAAAAGAFVLAGKEAYDLTQEAVELGGAVYDASLKMTMTVASTDALRFASVAAGGSLEQMSNLVFMMQQRMDLQPVKFQQGLAALNVSAAEFAALGTDQKVLAISDAMREAGDSTNLQATAMDLFGKSGRESLSLLLKPMADLVDQGNALGVMTTDEAKAAEDLAVQERILGLEYEHLKLTIGSDLVPAMTFLVENVKAVGTNFLKGSDDGLAFDLVVGKITSDFHSLKAAWDLWNGTAEELPKITGDAKKGVDDLDAGVKALTADGAGLVLTTGDQKTAIRDLEADYTKIHAAAVAWAAAMGELATAGVGWKGTLDGIDGSVVEAVKGYLDAGVSAKALGVIYELNATQLKAIEDGRKDDIATLKLHEKEAADAAKTEEAQYAELQKVTDAYYKTVNAASHDTLTTQVNDAYLAADAKIAAMQKSKSYSVAAEMEVWAAANQTANNIIQKSLESDVSTKEHYQLLKDKAQDAYDFALAHATSYTDARILQLRTEAQAAADTLTNWAAASDAALTGIASAAGIAATAIKTMQAAMTGTATSQFSLNPLDPNSWAAKIASFGPSAQFARDSAGNPYVYIPGVNAAPPRAEGGPVSAGMPYTVGEKGPELFVPQANGSIVPNGAAGGTTIVQHIYITQPLGTPQQLAAAINAAQGSRLKAIGVRLPGTS